MGAFGWLARGLLAAIKLLFWAYLYNRPTYIIGFFSLVFFFGRERERNGFGWFHILVISFFSVFFLVVVKAKKVI